MEKRNTYIVIYAFLKLPLINPDFNLMSSTFIIVVIILHPDVPNIPSDLKLSETTGWSSADSIRIHLLLYYGFDTTGLSQLVWANWSELTGLR